MSDAATRTLERAVAAGEPGARAALMAAKLRMGEVERERLELAAYLGDEDAKVVTSLSRCTGCGALEDEHGSTCDECGSLDYCSNCGECPGERCTQGMSSTTLWKLAPARVPKDLTPWLVSLPAPPFVHKRWPHAAKAMGRHVVMLRATLAVGLAYVDFLPPRAPRERLNGLLVVGIGIDWLKNPTKANAQRARRIESADELWSGWSLLAEGIGAEGSRHLSRARRPNLAFPSMRADPLTAFVTYVAGSGLVRDGSDFCRRVATTSLLRWALEGTSL